MDARRPGFTLLELMIVVAIVLTLLAVSAPHLMHSKMTANEAVARESLHTVYSALFEYWTVYRTYPVSLADLGSGSQLGPSSAELINPVLAGGHSSGYALSYIPVQAGPDGVISSYTITATPNAMGITGHLLFSMDQTGAVQVSTRLNVAASPAISDGTNDGQK